uniref:CGP-CTERM sorting domain-containing protein n=1 Tax=Thermococcus onnurineus TaxID=342948 RepID=UPI0023681EE8|nr:CGP-CTERM sorting domain-containing protein [Thermococcus onnurineus]
MGSRVQGIQLDGPQFVTNFIKWAIYVQQELGKETATETGETSTEGGETGSTCGPAALVGLALIPLVLYKRRK